MSLAGDGPFERVVGGQVDAATRTQWLGLLVAALVLVVIVRVYVPYEEVFRDGAVVLAGNDPYFYRYWIDRLLASGGHPLVPADISQLPGAIRDNDSMMVWSIWLISWILGGTGQTAGTVLAWYPVGAAVLTAVLLYVLVVWLTRDHPTAVLAVVILGLTPAHAYRTMLGFADHHAFDYVALMLTATALAWLVSIRPTEGRPWARRDWWLVAGLLGGAVTAQSLGWDGGPLLFGPLVGYALVAPALAVRVGRSPAVENSGLVVGLGVAAILTAYVRLGLDLVPAYRGLAPLLLFGMVVALLAVAELVHRRELSWRVVPATSPAIVGGWLVSIWVVYPWLLAPMIRFIEFLESAALKQSIGIGETASLIGSIRVPLLLFGLLLLVAVPVMVRGVVLITRWHRPDWIVALAYGWFFLGLSVNRIRFTGFLAMFVAAFTAVGVVYLTEYYFERWTATPLETELGGASPRVLDVPSRRALLRTGRVIAVVLLLVGLGVAQLPGTMDQITYDDAEYEVATWMAEYSDERGWAYPENYVFSEWGSNRFYNYEVNGESESYRYALENYRRFVSSNDPTGWYDALAGGTGFIVIRSSGFAYPSDSMQIRLDERYGSAGDGVAGLAHYRLIYRSQNGLYSVFTLVPGATIAGNASPNATVDVQTEVSVGETTFTYRRSVLTDGGGRFEVTVPYPGEYAVAGETVSVTEADVREGKTVQG